MLVDHGIDCTLSWILGMAQIKLFALGTTKFTYMALLLMA
jgi:hypothetical protein